MDPSPLEGEVQDKASHQQNKSQDSYESVGVAFPQSLNLGHHKGDGLGIRDPQSTIGQPRANGCDNEVTGHPHTLPRSSTGA